LIGSEKMKSELKSTEQEDGYTLIESVVAMAIFLTVVLLLVGSIGNMMFASRSSSLEKAVMLAEKELAKPAPAELGERTTAIEGFLVERTVVKKKAHAEVTVKIFPERASETTAIVSLTKVVTL
jgi:prepilin-type N-terminal cleavage/methylation domain-containing protein